MEGLSMPWALGLIILALTNATAASPLFALDVLRPVLQPQRSAMLDNAPFEWTAFGDSYSSGVGAGEYIRNSYRCLRYSHAYPGQIDRDPRLPAGKHDFHNAVCSGSNTTEVELYQFYDKDEFGKPNWQYGDRPKFGNPTVGTLSVGGNDIDFPGIIFNCILDYNFRKSGIKQRSCDAQRDYTWSLLRDPGLIDKVDNTIKKIVDRARRGPVGDKFKLYVTGFPQFFSTETNECDSVTFAWGANPKDDGKPHPKMTQSLRKEFNDMSIQLNKAISSAVSRNTDRGVKWIPMDDMMDGHRFCEKGIKEPDQKNPNLWLFHFPYKESKEPKEDEIDGILEDAYERLGDSIKARADKMKYADLQELVLDNVTPPAGDPRSSGWLDWLWSRVGAKVKMFHPQVALHEKMRDRILAAYLEDMRAGNASKPTAVSTSAPSASSLPPPKEELKCHGISGDYWVMAYDRAVESVKEFCRQDSQEVVYNKDTVNELSLSAKNTKDPKKGPKDSPDCEGRFIRSVLDSCDGNDPKNPHNFKFGSTYKTTDYWVYEMKPLSKQVNDVRCDVSYKLALNWVEIRGKRFDEDKLGQYGRGLLDNLRGCGAVEKWQWELTPYDRVYEWYAYAQMAIGTKNCVGNAIRKAGGIHDGGCKGPGKRSGGNDIDLWPGYGDDGYHFNQTTHKRDDIDSWPGYGDDSVHVFGKASA